MSNNNVLPVVVLGSLMVDRYDLISEGEAPLECKYDDGEYVRFEDYESDLCDEINSIQILLGDRELLEKENAELKEQIVKMRTECNKRFSEQLQKIRKLKAANMLQKQNVLFDE